MFKRKQERSEWMKGLLDAEMDVNYEDVSDLKWKNTYNSLYISEYFPPEYTGGYSDYLDHYENNLKNILG